MKKILILFITALFVLGLVSSAFAATPAATNPFSKVPNNHWAYQSLASLAKAGIIDGYTGGDLQGDKFLTRYEAAQLVAKALAYEGKTDAETKAAIDKLAVEFSTELNNLGVRVATVETKTSSIKFSGDSRTRWQSNYGLNGGATSNSAKTAALDRFQFRVRLFVAADVNDNLSFDGVVGWQNQNGLSGTSTTIGRNSLAQLERANFTLKNVFSGGSVSAGRLGNTLGATGLAYDVQGGWFDGLRVNYSNKNLSGLIGYGDLGAEQDNGLPNAASLSAAWAPQAATIGQLAWNINKSLTLYSAGLFSNSNTYRIKDTILGVKTTANDFTLTADYVHNNWDFGSTANISPNAWYSKLAYKGATANKPGSWGLYVDYRKVGAQSIDSRITTLNTAGAGSFAGYVSTADGLTATGIKGLGYGFNYGLSKGATLAGTVESLKSYDGAVKYNNFYSLTANFNF